MLQHGSSAHDFHFITVDQQLMIFNIIEAILQKRDYVIF